MNKASSTDVQNKPFFIGRLFHYYNIYRLVICTLLVITNASDESDRYLRHPEQFEFLVFTYLFLSIFIEIFIVRNHQFTRKQVFASVLTDIGILHGLFYFGIGITGGLVNLQIIVVAAANILIRGRIGFLFAAIAALATLGLEIEAILFETQNSRGIGQAGITGAVYFATAFIIQNISSRISQSEALAAKQHIDILELEKLNHQIIQSMRTGIIVADDQLNIKLMNEATTDLLGPFEDNALPQFLIERIDLWKQNPNLRTTPFQMNPDKPLVQANFMSLKKDTGNDLLIFLEDNRLMAQQAQQLKLASLGRLTASIAHEVRNPLGAISHATQLLEESEHLDDSDLRMTDIIKRHAKRVNHIIENILQLSRRKEPQVQEIKLASWLQQTINDYCESVSGKPDITMTNLVEDASARFDSNQIEQVLINLIENGLRYSKENIGSERLLIILGIREETDQAYIDVRDFGVGIPEQDIPHLFEPFFTTASQGTGLGLYLSKELCESNQAQLECRPSESGACFRILFAHPKRVF